MFSKAAQTRLERANWYEAYVVFESKGKSKEFQKWWHDDNFKGHRWKRLYPEDGVWIHWIKIEQLKDYVRFKLTWADHEK